MTLTRWRQLIVFLVIFLWVASGCGAEIDSSSDDVFRFDGWSKVGWSDDEYRLEFTNMTTDKSTEWRGKVDAVLDKLLVLNAGECYTHPLTNPDQVPCG